MSENFIDALDNFEMAVHRRWGKIKCFVMGHPPMPWPGTGWIQTWRLCPRCGSRQHITAKRIAQ
ncbi:Uncharacterised protein [Mycobacteroides abscessus subsp. abscessus]|jgi:hypothetical protein|nr:Uncharacterised protein [Mycobacteroides abscessus subsp. abscessus]SKL81416.1 Uncharacterised protein [Mycobacteroides abscessus subsp. abscessus]SKM52197.1 Uncharacterised protein [Mycobacteroides abscessus subsp. abscessus]SLK34382.1 Uncharacterised protein [Mycobacteroides abscessus subsp. abscessus]